MLDEPRRPGPVAVIEDDEMSRHAIGRLLQAGGFEPTLFESAETFLQSPPSRDWLCLIVDVQLPGMSGIDLQRRLRLERPEVPIIVTTGNRQEVIRERAHQAGCAAFLWKPFSSDSILTTLASIAHQSDR